MVTVTYSETLAYAASAVFAVLRDLEVRQRWQASLVSLRAEPPGLLTSATRIVEVRKYMGYKTETTLLVSLYEPDRQLTLETPPEASALQRESYTLESLSEQSCRLAYTVEASGIPRLFEGPARKAQERELPQNIEKLKTILAERTAQNA